MRDAMDTENSQLELLKEAQQGDRAAFETLLGQSREELEKFVTTRIGDHLRSRVETDDVLQDTCARAWASIGEIRWTGPERASIRLTLLLPTGGRPSQRMA